MNLNQTYMLKVEGCSQQRKICLLCFCLSNLRRIANSSSVERNNFKFLEAQIGYTLPEFVCSKCLEKLYEIGTFIQMCKESREKYLKLIQLTKPVAQTSTKMENTESKPEETFEAEVDNSEDLASPLTESAGTSPESEIVIHVEPAELSLGNSVDRTEESESIDVQSAETNVASPSSICVVKIEEYESEILTEPIETNVNLGDIVREHSYHTVGKKTTVPNRRKVKVCPECNQNVTRYIDHYKESPQCKPKNVSCSMCALKFENSLYLYRHQVIKHSDRISVELFVCHLCAQTFKYKCNLQRHLRVHEHGKQFVCDRCGKGFTCKAQLQEHALIHLNIKPYLCNKCGKQFSSRKMFSVHERAHENNSEDSNESYVCKICDRSFTKSGLKTHMHTHAENKVYKCRQCDESFATTRLYRRHMKIHPKDFVMCPICSKRVVRHTLKQHIRTHSEERPFPCTKCHKSFRTRAHLEYHLAALHDALGIVRYQCSICKKRFGSRGTLEKHEMLHVGAEPYKCHLCDEDFVCAVSRRRHIAQVHGKHEAITYLD